MPHLLDSFTQLPILTSRQPLTNSPLSFPSNHPPYVFFPRDLNIACLAAACSAFPGELSVKVSPGFRWRGGGSSEAMGSFEMATLTPASSKPTIPSPVPCRWTWVSSALEPSFRPALLNSLAEGSSGRGGCGGAGGSIGDGGRGATPTQFSGGAFFAV